MNARNDVLVGFTEFQSDDFADAAYAYRAGTDPPWTMREPVTLKDGEGPYTKTRGGLNRWGDYSGTQVDPSDDLAAVDGAGIRAHPDRPGRRVGPLGNVVGPGRRRPAVARAAMQGAEGGRRRPRESVAAGRSRALPPLEGASREGPEKRGRVVRQSPGAGQIRRSDARISLTVGR